MRGSSLRLQMRFHHYRAVGWVLADGPLSHAYTAVVTRDDCPGCVVCQRTTDWFMDFARLARALIGINLRDCLHWGHLRDNPQPLIVSASNLQACNRATLVRLRGAYYALAGSDRPVLTEIWSRDRHLSQGDRFEDRLAILARMVELWEDGQYIGWPS
ncbi:MAG: hypothetical protein AABZ75_03475 [candidate division NC10 bacterium]|mgnify:FL=1